MEREWSERARRALLAAGWSPGRDVLLPGRVAESLAADGHALHEPAERFLREFMGLRLVYAHARVPDAEDDCFIDALTAAADVDPAWARSYEERTGESRFVPVGEASRGYLTLYMSETGRVYGGYDQFLCRLGDTGAAALEALCNGLHAEEVA